MYKLLYINSAIIVSLPKEETVLCYATTFDSNMR